MRTEVCTVKKNNYAAPKARVTGVRYDPVSAQAKKVTTWISRYFMKNEHVRIKFPTGMPSSKNWEKFNAWR